MVFLGQRQECRHGLELGRSWAYSSRAGQRGARHTLISVRRRRARSLRAAPSEHLPSPGSPAASLRLSTRSDRHRSPRPRVGAVLGLFRPCRPAWCSPCPHFSPRRSWGASFALEVCVCVWRCLGGPAGSSSVSAQLQCGPPLHGGASTDGGCWEALLALLMSRRNRPYVFVAALKS